MDMIKTNGKIFLVVCFFIRKKVLLMSQIKKENLKDYAKKLMFDMDESEYDTLLNEFDIILKQMDLIGNIKNINEVEPMSFPFIIDSKTLRPDVVTSAITVEDALSNVKERIGNEIKVPKVVE